MSEQQRRRIERLEQDGHGGQRLRVVEWYPPDGPRPEAGPGELLIIIRRFSDEELADSEPEEDRR